MPEKIVHPDWLAVGRVVRTVRRSSISHTVVHDAEVLVTRHTKASVFVRYPNSAQEYRYAKHWGQYVATPRYLDYHEVLEPKEKADE